MALPPVSVVIPTYNDRDVLSATLAPLLADEATGEIVIVVDGSTDGSYELLQSMAQQDDRLRPFLIENRGRTGAGQYALQQVSHDIVLMLDADVVAAPGLVSSHARVHTEGERPRLVMGYMPTPVPAPGPGSFVHERYADQYELACAAWERDPRNIFYRHWAGNVSCPRQILIDAGGYDAGAPIKYMDDLEMGLRLARTELEPMFDRTLLAEHRLKRSVASYVSTSRKYGQAIVMIDQLHPGQVYAPGWLTAKSGRDAAIRRFTSRPYGYTLAFRTMMAALDLGARLKLWTLQRHAAAVIDRLETLQGVIEQSRLVAS
jgi:glycosyltransferase involved in cell wall biosynthesis